MKKIIFRSFLSYVHILVFVIFIISFGIWFFIFKLGDQSNYQLLNLQKNQKTISYLTLDQWNNFRSEYFSIVDNQNPRIALEKLRKVIETNNALSRNCHELTHEIGHEAFKKYNTFGNAIQYQDDVCNSGYIHGVLESYFEQNKNNISFALDTACKQYLKNNYNAWECYHGMGHGLMFITNNDVPISISLCNKLKNNFEVSACINGLFMQNFNSDQLIHPSKFVNNKNFFYPCNIQTVQNMSNCYLYAPSRFLALHNENYLDALDWCNQAPLLFVNICINGVGSEMMKQNINNPKLVEKICSSLKNISEDSCIEGMINQYILHYGNPIPAQNLCKKMENKNISTCIKTINNAKDLFLPN